MKQAGIEARQAMMQCKPRRSKPLSRIQGYGLAVLFVSGALGGALLRAPESAHQQWGGSPHRTEHWLSVAEGNWVVERRGGEQPEANDQSIIKKMMNSIRPDALANTRGSEVKPRTEADPERESGNSATWPAASTVSVGQGCMGGVEIEWSEVGAT